jgi:hypothetical protein
MSGHFLIVEARFYDEIADAQVAGRGAGVEESRCKLGTHQRAWRSRDTGGDSLCRNGGPAILTAILPLAVLSAVRRHIMILCAASRHVH